MSDPNPEQQAEQEVFPPVAKQSGEQSGDPSRNRSFCRPILPRRLLLRKLPR